MPREPRPTDVSQAGAGSLIAPKPSQLRARQRRCHRVPRIARRSSRPHVACDPCRGLGGDFPRFWTATTLHSFSATCRAPDSRAKSSHPRRRRLWHRQRPHRRDAECQATSHRFDIAAPVRRVLGEGRLHQVYRGAAYVACAGGPPATTPQVSSSSGGASSAMSRSTSSGSSSPSAHLNSASFRLRYAW